MISILDMIYPWNLFALFLPGGGIIRPLYKLTYRDEISNIYIYIYRKTFGELALVIFTACIRILKSYGKQVFLAFGTYCTIIWLTNLPSALWIICWISIPLKGYYCSNSTERNDANLSIQYGFRIDGLVQDCSNSSAWAMALLQFCTKPSINEALSEHLFDDSLE